jgi:hypothetical protein
MMKKIQVAAAVALALSSVSFAQQAVQWKVSEGGNGHWYTVVPQELSWTQARSAAETMGAHLVTITSSGENSFVGTLAPLVGSSVFGAWAGGYQTDNSCGAACSWTWVTGEAWGYANWWVGEPNDVSGIESSLEIFVYQAANYWSDAPDSQAYLRRFAVEWDADCNGDGIVDYGQCRDGSLPDYNGNNIPDCCESGTPCVVGSYPVQWRAEDGGNGHWYSQSGFGLFPSWSAALEFARSRGAYLATLTSQQEQSFVASLARPATCEGGGGWSWLGAQQPPGLPPNQGWQWITDEPWIFTNWAPGEPNDFGGLPEDRLSMYLSTGNIGLWNDGTDLVSNPASCNYSAMLEWSADCNNDGLVDKGQILRGQLADSDNDGIPNVCECVCDVFRDFNVNGIDLGILLGQWGPANQFTVTDFNQDGSVDGFDLGVLLGAWGPCPN